MDSTALNREVKNLLSYKKIDKGRLNSAEKAAFQTMSRYLDLPSAEAFGDFTVTSGTPNYEGQGSMDEVGAQISRITSAVFVGSTSFQPLEEWGIRRYQYHYRGQSSTAIAGKPSAFTYYNGYFWLYKVPDLSGTVYYTAQKVLTDIVDFPDDYLPIMLELVKLHLAEPEDMKEQMAAQQAWRLAKSLIKSFKGTMHPKKDTMEMTTHRASRVAKLSESY